MGNNKNNKVKNSSSKQAAPTIEKKEKKSGTEIFLIVFAIVAIIGIAASIIIGVVASTSKSKTFDYLKTNLNRYVSIDGDYKTLTVDVTADPVQDDDVEHEILKALFKNKDKTPIGDGKGYTNVKITAGDIVSLYYRGYTIENGKKVDFDGGCNFTGEIAQLGIGSGSFIVGFENALVGKNPSDYSSLKTYGSTGTIGANDKIFIVYTRTLNDGTVTPTATAVVDLSLGKEEIDEKFGTLFYSSMTGVERSYGEEIDFDVETDNGGEKIKLKAYRATSDGQLISVTYSAFMANGDVQQSKSVLVDLSDPDLDSKYGKGFREFFLKGVPVGTKAVDSANKSLSLKTEDSEGRKSSYFDITVSKVFDVGKNPLTIEVRFPYDYGSEDLRGKQAFFDVYVSTVEIYDAKYDSPADIDDKFVTDTLKISAESLKDYEGDTLVAKYRAKIRADLEKTYNEAVIGEVNSALLTHYVSKATVKKLPESEVNVFYNQYLADIQDQYTQYSMYYNSFDAFAREYMQLASNADWSAELTKRAEETAKQKLVFFYVMKENDLIIPDDEKEARYQTEFEEIMEMYLANENCKPENFDTVEEYEAKRAELYKKYSEGFNKDYLYETITYDYALEKLREYVTVNTPGTK